MKNAVLVILRIEKVKLPSIFGLGWVLKGACPGPIFVNIGYGYYAMVLVFIGALIRTYLYGVVRAKLAH